MPQVKNKNHIDCTAVTQSADDNSTKIATTAYADAIKAAKADSGANSDIT